MTKPDGLERFFASYCDAFNRLDALAIGAHYCVPAILTNQQGQIIWSDRQAIEANMIALCGYYRSHEFTSAAFEVLACIDQPPAHAVAELRWTVQRARTHPAVRFCTGYNLRRHAGEWRILLCTAYEEVPFG